MSEIIFLGTGPTKPVRRKARRSERTNSSILLKTDNSILIDCTPNFLEQISREDIDPEEIDYVFITHGHKDCISGLPQLDKLALRKIPLYASRKTLSRIQENFKLKNFEFREFQCYEEIKMNYPVNWRLHYTPVLLREKSS